MGWGSFNIGVSGLRAAQVGLDVTSHNISNVNTPYFKRQVVDLGEVTYPDNIPGTPDGKGVEVTNIRNAQDNMLSRLYPGAISDKNYYDTLSDLNKKLKDLLSDPANNISQGMQNVFNAFQEVANNPTSVPIRQNAINAAENLETQNRSLQTQLAQTTDFIDKDKRFAVSEINTILQGIQKINSTVGAPNGSISDSTSYAQKQSLIYKLSEFVGINISPDGMSITTKSGQSLVQNGTATTVTSTDLDSWTGGKIGAYNEFINTTVPNATGAIPGILRDLTDNINNIATAGYDLNGQPGQPIFSMTGTDSNTFGVSLTDPVKIGASTTPLPGMADGTNAQNVSQIRNLKFNHETLQDRFTNLVTDAAQKASAADLLKGTYDSAYNAYGDQIKGLSDVNLDEEAVNLMKYQRMYEANAQVIKTANEMLGTLLNINA